MNMEREKEEWAFHVIATLKNIFAKMIESNILQVIFSFYKCKMPSFGYKKL